MVAFLFVIAMDVMAVMGVTDITNLVITLKSLSAEPYSAYFYY